MATKWNFLANSLKIFSSETAGRILKLFHRICSLGDPFQKLIVKFWFVKTFGSGEWGATCTIQKSRNSLKIFSSETAGRILELFHRYVPWVTLFINCSWNFDPSKNVALVNGGYLHYTEIKEFFKNLLLWNRWSDFEIISQGCSLGDPFQNSFVKFWSIKKCGPGEWGLLALYRNEGILKKSSSLKPLVRFWNNFTELFLGWPFSKIVREILIGEETWLWWMGATCTIGKWGNS